MNANDNIHLLAEYLPFVDKYPVSYFWTDCLERWSVQQFTNIRASWNIFGQVDEPNHLPEGPVLEKP